jgi:hypothetical protein
VFLVSAWTSRLPIQLSEKRGLPLWDFLVRICAGKIACGGWAVLLGIFQFLVCFVMVICGEFVVECVVNVVFYQTLFRGLKMGQVFEVYFLVAAVWVR